MKRCTEVTLNLALSRNAIPVASVTTELQSASEINIGMRRVRPEFHEVGFHSRAAAHTHKITMHNAKRGLEWCKVLTLDSGAVEKCSLE